MFDDKSLCRAFFFVFNGLSCPDYSHIITLLLSYFERAILNIVVKPQFQML